MPELPRDLPHLYIRGSGRAEPYTSKLAAVGGRCPSASGRLTPMPFGFRSAAALAAAEAQQRLRDPDIAAGAPGFYLDFEIAAGSE